MYPCIVVYATEIGLPIRDVPRVYNKNAKVKIPLILIKIILLTAVLIYKNNINSTNF